MVSVVLPVGCVSPWFSAEHIYLSDQEVHLVWVMMATTENNEVSQPERHLKPMLQIFEMKIDWCGLKYLLH